jgi:DNA polymerase elongation subunit (family B)
LKGKYPLYNFVTSKTLKSNYKDRTRIAHVCLADRMMKRDPGNAPQINERVQYAAIVVPEKKGLLQGDRIEHPDYITENNLEVDYLFYLTNQIKNPTVQFLELLVDDPESIFKEAIEIENNKRAGNVSISKFFNVKKKKILGDLSVKKKKAINKILFK